VGDKKVYQTNKDGSKVRDKSGFDRYSKPPDKTVYGSSYKIGVGTKKISSGKKK
jgi:hypothetical protein